MERDKQVQRFFKLCENSFFPHKKDLINGINEGKFFFKSFSDSQVHAKELAEIYKIKAMSAGRHQSIHANRLVKDTLSFVSELEKVPNDKVNFWHFSIDEATGYTIFEGVNSQKVLGCILTVDKRKVSEDEWEKLWNE
jgi:hypothetical protein